MSSSDTLGAYVSFDTALSIHGILDDVTHVTRIACVRGDYQTRRSDGRLVEGVALPDDLLFGASPADDPVLDGLPLAEPEKALCDLLWLCESRGTTVPVDSLRLDDVDLDRLRRYAERMGVELRRLGGGSGR